MQRKVYFVLERRTTSPESRKILHNSVLELYNFCGFVRKNVFFFDQNICQFQFEKKNIYRFYTFQGGGVLTEIVKFFI